MLIAGHVFDAASGLCSCGRKFSDISGVEHVNIGMEHWAHVGNLTTAEHDQIVAERERLYRSLTGAPAPGVAQAEDNTIFG